ncbi:MAG: thymidylate kinase [Clostridiales bacterium]|nr:thymidylate kinase [Clostridiales bacterium]
MSKIISIDGLDGSGKGTQAALLNEYFKSKGKQSHLLSFPMYDNVSATFVKMYLEGELGRDPSATNAYAASSFYAMDRYISYRTEWGRLCSEDGIVIFNRYTTANAVHQLSKLPKEEWDDFLAWLWDYEFSKLSLPVPDIIFYLVVSPEISMGLVEKRSSITGQKMDIHELDKGHIYQSYNAGLYAAKKLGWIMIHCCENGQMRSIDDIQAEIRSHAKVLL